MWVDARGSMGSARDLKKSRGAKMGPWERGKSEGRAWKVQGRFHLSPNNMKMSKMRVE
jgi:hypothetical protein